MGALPPFWRFVVVSVLVLAVLVLLIGLALSGILARLTLAPLAAIVEGGLVLGLSLLSLIVGNRAAVAPTITTGDLLRAALPMGLSAFWLLAAWLLDSEARRAFPRREPWGERLAAPYSCLAAGCLAPLILAGVLVGAWGYVSFLQWTAGVWGWEAALRAGGAILLVVVILLWSRNLLARWWLARRVG